MLTKNTALQDFLKVSFFKGLKVKDNDKWRLIVGDCYDQVLQVWFESSNLDAY